MTAAEVYCYWLQNNTENQVAYCGNPPPDPIHGAGAITTNWDTGTWSEWIYPWKATSSIWYAAYKNKVKGLVALCTETQTGGQSCASD